ncbi:primosomal protein N' [Candidatus Peregrinibacteria bacterium CG_4_10_14_0_2_um_filter_38_24]|nr:MAG: primosomal protein N' [Candidatus Peregrinibacteria bacterium CG_4_10_14_0_2_um_filter_38_24]PJC38850.1 MAG: primosomal protein N' [Candidatus Peregrinibacteria bacterium CG_4_9_14_0_2_um_filter_38_9]
MKYAQVLFPQKIIFKNQKDNSLEELNSTLTYKIPENLNVEKGSLVKAPIRNSQRIGIVLRISEAEPPFRTFEIREIMLPYPVLTNSQIELLKWISSYYYCPIHQIIKLFIPKKLLIAKETKKRTTKPKTREVEQIISSKKKDLTEEQEKAINKILKDSSNTFLIQGVTGSGKTEIYVHLAKYFINQNLQVLILVPEIALTPQTIEYFERSIGINASVIHSKLSEGERIRNWKDISGGKSKLIIGSRSSIFTPFKNLGLIIIDEEHESSYKQENSPRYSVQRIAEKIQELSKDQQIKIVYGSATPSIEIAEKLKNSTIKLFNRIGDIPLPAVEIVDLREEFKKQNHSIFSERLQEELRKVLAEKKQAILFLNRRGSSSSVVCRDCGFIYKCEDCEMPMTYHEKTLGSPTMICHHCGKILKPPSTCPTCKGVNIRFLGIGTERIEKEIQKLFPKAKIVRADKDTTSKKDSFKTIYEDFKNHKADILVGTQMIAKGLHLPLVNLVGVVLADIGLNIPDFKTLEKNFQLLTQVSGRAGRTDTKGKVIIQTYNPDNLALKYTKENSYDEFFKYEITQRKLLLNPPFSHLIKIMVEDKSLKNCQTKTEKLYIQINKILSKLNAMSEVEVLKYPAYMIKLHSKYRYIILLKSVNREILDKTLENIAKEIIMDTSIKIDIDPNTTS